MITLKKLTWDNCFSYGENNELQLDENTLTQIIGTNGVGKSSIPLIIEEVLYNKNSKGVKKADLPNRYKDGSYKIGLELTKNEEEYYIEVVRKGATIKVKLLHNGEDISSHTATNTFKTIAEDIIGIDFKTFSQLVYQNTNASLQFLTATDTARKKFLIDLLGLEDYLVHYETFKEAVKNVNLEIAGFESSIKTIENWLQSNKLTTTDILPIKEVPQIPRELEDELADKRNSLKNISATNRKISQNNEYKKLLSTIDIIQVQNIPETERIDDSDIKAIIADLRAEKQSNLNLINKLKKLGGICPTCEQEIDIETNAEIIFQNEAKVKAIDEKMIEATAILDKRQLNNKNFDEKQAKIKEWEELYRLYDKEMPSALIDEVQLKKDITAIEKHITELKNQQSTIIANNQKAEKHNTRIQVILEQTEKFTENYQKEMRMLESVQTTASHLEILKKAFSTNGLLAYKIENLVKELEELTNNYLAELSDGRFTIEFVVTNDKLNVQITDNGKIVDISVLSSGELARVNTATLLAIRKLMSGISKTRINVLFLDEVINVLDELGREKLVEILVKEDELNTYLVSHGWTHPLISKIEITKRDNISFLE